MVANEVKRTTDSKADEKREARKRKHRSNFIPGDIVLDGIDAMIIIAGYVTPHSGRRLYIGVGMDGELVSQYEDGLESAAGGPNILRPGFVKTVQGDNVAIVPAPPPQAWNEPRVAKIAAALAASSIPEDLAAAMFADFSPAVRRYRQEAADEAAKGARANGHGIGRHDGNGHLVGARR